MIDGGDPDSISVTLAGLDSPNNDFVDTINNPPVVIPPGIPDVTILTSSPQATIPLFPTFEDPEHPDNQLTYTVTGNTNIGEVTVSTIGASRHRGHTAVRGIKAV